MTTWERAPIWVSPVDRLLFESWLMTPVMDWNQPWHDTNAWLSDTFDTRFTGQWSQCGFLRHGYSGGSTMRRVSGCAWSAGRVMA